MSSSASVPGQRRTARGVDDATNKKKQKDRANQESKEGEKPAGSDSKKGTDLSYRYQCIYTFNGMYYRDLAAREGLALSKMCPAGFQVWHSTETPG